ncbi:MAG: NAD-dependent epimerase [Bacteroidetes bacterium SW_9_63_38]|nr:MAG: NAD-dependent epimerase [Bacteroidetes bacterium SW_9_63_38]
MRVFLTGATGYVGSYVLRTLLDQGHRPRCLVRGSGDDLVRHDDPVDVVSGDVTDPTSLNGLLDDCDAVIHLVGIIEEHPRQGVTFERIHVDGTRHVVEAARAAGVDRFIHMSANGAQPNDATGYQRTKWEAEQIVNEAGFDHWTIFRPALLFGAPDPGRPEFSSRLLKKLVRPFPLLPVFGDGQYDLQPVHVTEVADAFVQALTTEAAREQTYVAAGPDRIPYVEVLDRIARGAGFSPKPTTPVPLALARLGVYTAGRLGLLPISPSQFEMLVEGNTGDETAFYRDFALSATPYTPETLQYLQST